MSRRTTALAGLLAATSCVGMGGIGVGGAAATPVDKGQFHDTFTGPVVDCEGTPVQDHVDITGTYVLNQRGPSPFPYYRESTRGTITWTNLDTGGTFTRVFTANSRDTRITDNGNGTITIVVSAAGGSRFYDSAGRLVLKDPGAVRYSFAVDYHGTPGDVEDDTDVPDSFQVLKPSTGHSDLSTRDFCDDLRQFAR